MSQDPDDDVMLQLFECMRRPVDSVNLRRFFLMLMRAHWMDPANHGPLAEPLGCMVYSEDPKKKSLDVRLAHDYEGEAGSSVPAIYVGFNGFKLGKLFIGDAVGRTGDNSARREGKRVDTVLKVAHRARSADQALLMAESGATLLQGIHKDIMANIPLLAFSVDMWTDAERKESGATRYFQVDLVCSLAFNFQVEIDMESHRIKKFGSTVNATT